MGADFYDIAGRSGRLRRAGEPAVGIGENSVIEGAIIDKNCRIGRNVRVTNDRGLETTRRNRPKP